MPGLAAKPILDLHLSVDALQPRARYVEPLERLGYLFVPAPESPDYHFFAKPPERPRTHHLHVGEVGSAHEFRHLAVRDFLRSHHGEAVRYAALKRHGFGGGRAAEARRRRRRGPTACVPSTTTPSTRSQPS